MKARQKKGQAESRETRKCEMCPKVFPLTRRDKVLCGSKACERKKARRKDRQGGLDAGHALKSVEGQDVIERPCEICGNRMLNIRGDARTHPACRQVKHRRAVKQRAIELPPTAPTVPEVTELSLSQDAMQAIAGLVAEMIAATTPRQQPADMSLLIHQAIEADRKADRIRKGACWRCGGLVANPWGICLCRRCIRVIDPAEVGDEERDNFAIARRSVEEKDRAKIDMKTDEFRQRLQRGEFDR